MLGLPLQYVEFHLIPLFFFFLSSDKLVCVPESFFQSRGCLRVGLLAPFSLLLLSLIPYLIYLFSIFFFSKFNFCGSEVQIGLLLDDFSLFMLSSQLWLVIAFSILLNWLSLPFFQCPVDILV